MSKNYTRVGVLGLFIWLSVNATSLFGQEVGTYFDYLNVESGLSNNEVTATVQDKYGFIWIGTRGGLNRYDGYQYVQYKNKISRTNSLVNNSIECLYSDGDYLWIGTKSGGLSRYDQAKELFTNYQYDPRDEHSLSQNRIVSIFVDSKNRRWFGTFKNGINLYNETKNVFSHYLGRKKINRIIEDTQGNIWTVTNLGIFLFNENKNIFEQIPVLQDVIKQATDITLKGNTLFIATWLGNIIQFDIQSKKILQIYTKDLIFGNQQKQVNIYRIFKDKSGRILVGTWGDGVYVLNEKETRFTKINLYPSEESSSVAFNVVLDIFEDKVGNIWIGTNSGGIVRLVERNAKFQTLNLDNASRQLLKNLHINAVFKDSWGNLWLATKGKGVFIQKNSEKVLKQFPLPFNNKIWQVANDFLEDENGNMWIGTAQGIYIIDEHFQIIEHLYFQKMDSASLSATQITSLFKDSRGITWVGTQQQGLNKLLKIVDGQYIFQRYKVIPGRDGFLNNPRITCFSEESSGKIWIGTYGGLHLFDSTKDWFTCFKVEKEHENGISSNIITSLDIDKQHNLWIGTPNGLNHLNLTLDTYDFTASFEDNRFQNSYINAIESDQFGQIWISTNQGISNYNPKTLEFRNYDLSDGLSSLSYSENGSFVARNGLIYFGGAKGVTSFRPQQIEDNTIIPNVYLTSLSINDHKLSVGQAINGRIVLEKSIKETKDLLLNYKDRIVEFQFAALNYIASQNNRYKYQLEGYDKNWIVANRSRTATYTELPAGDYVFKVMGSYNSNLWNEEPVRLKIGMSPPPWESTLAKTLYVVFFITLLYFIQKVTIAQQRLRQDLKIANVKSEQEAELHEMKSQFFTNVSHEIRTPLTLIAGPLEEILENPNTDGVIRQKLNSVHLNTTHLMRLVSQLLEFRKIEQNQQRIKAAKGNFILFCEEIYLSFKAYAHSKNIDFEYSTDSASLEVWYDRPKFEIILSNLLLNAFKHTPSEGKVSLKIENGDAHYAYLKIKDTGRGISTEQQRLVFDRFYQVTNSETVNITGSGIGLSLVKDLLDLHGGKISLNSIPSAGTTFTLMIPKGRNHLQAHQIIENFRNSSHPYHYQIERTTINSDKNAIAKKGYTILLIEDNPDIRKFLKNIFQYEYNLLEAENGKIGLEAALKELPDLIISDVMMPIMDGISLCDAIKSNIKTNHIPVILLTARTADFYKIEGLTSGADDYITKPFIIAEIKARVSNQILIRENLKERFSKMVSLEPSEIEITNLDEIFLNQAVTFVENNLDSEEMGAELFAKEMGMSHSTLYRKLKALTGQSISNFIKAIRLKIAAQYLIKSNHSIKEITYLTGFSDVKYFRKCFVEQFQATPSDFKRRNIEQVITRKDK